LSFAAAVKKTAETTQQQPPRQVAPAGPNGREEPQPSCLPDQQHTGQSVQGNSPSDSNLDNMFRVVTAVQQIMTEFSGAVSEEQKILAITKIVLNLMKQNGQ
jgi:hypothetical protein